MLQGFLHLTLATNKALWWLTVQFLQLEAARLNEKAIAEEELKAVRSKQQELHAQLLEAWQVVHQLQTELQAIKTENVERSGASNCSSKGAKRFCAQVTFFPCSYVKWGFAFKNSLFLFADWVRPAAEPLKHCLTPLSLLS